MDHPIFHCPYLTGCGLCESCPTRIKHPASTLGQKGCLYGLLYQIFSILQTSCLICTLPRVVLTVPTPHQLQIHQDAGHQYSFLGRPCCSHPAFHDALRHRDVSFRRCPPNGPARRHANRPPRNRQQFLIFLDFYSATDMTRNAKSLQ